MVQMKVFKNAWWGGRKFMAAAAMSRFELCPFKEWDSNRYLRGEREGQRQGEEGKVERSVSQFPLVEAVH